jgi:hypothetical protein
MTLFNFTHEIWCYISQIYFIFVKKIRNINMKVGGVPARENMWHFIMFRENIFHISLKRKKKI